MKETYKEMKESLVEATDWISKAKIESEEENIQRALASATIALAHATIATVQYIVERDAEPHNHDKYMLDLGIEIGEQLSKRNEENDNNE